MADSRGRSWTLSSHSVKSSANHTEDGKPKRRLYGRKMTRPLGKERAHAYEKLMPVVSIPLETVAGTRNLKPSSLFKKSYEEHWLEIGYGNGEHLVALMERYPDVGLIGVEPFINGTAALMQHLEHRPIDNVRSFMDDAVLFVDALEDECVNRIYILNPDPWPKKRHAKRRIIQPYTLSEFSRILKPGGILVTCTDVNNLADWMVTQLMNHPDFEWMARNKTDWQTPPPEWIETRYAAKGKKHGRKQSFLIFRKIQ